MVEINRMINHIVSPVPAPSWFEPELAAAPGRSVAKDTAGAPGGRLYPLSGSAAGDAKTLPPEGGAAEEDSEDEC